MCRAAAPGAAEALGRLRQALELVHDPAVDLYKHVDPAPLSPLAASALERRSSALLTHCWALLREAYGIRRGADFYSVHRAGDPRNCLYLTPDARVAAAVAEWWAGPAVVVTRVPPPGGDASGAQEAWVALALALAWRRPAWLA